jgi:hypothetical protein
MHITSLKNHFLNTQGEDQVKRENERIQRKTCKDESVWCYKEKSKMVN